jgi:hypothetical protein
MRPSISHVGQDAIWVCGKAAVGKEHCLDPLPQLFIGQEQKVLCVVC